jgi:hypothetical protein
MIPVAAYEKIQSQLRSQVAAFRVVEGPLLLFPRYIVVKGVVLVHQTT